MKSIIWTALCLCLLVGCKSKKGIVTKRDRSASTENTRVVEKGEVIKEENVNEIIAEEIDLPAKKFKNATEEYIDQYAKIAVLEMKKYKIPASITLAQGILESGSGKGRLAVEANNHFGIKCHGWTGKKIYHDDDRRQECFRKYKHAKSSYEDHSEFLTTRSRYAELFTLRDGDYEGWAKGLKAAGYATDKKYPDKLISLIERYELYKYDALVLNNRDLAILDLPDHKSIETEIQEDDEDFRSDLDSVVTHKVAKGDTLYSLSRKYNTSVERIQLLNGLSGTTLNIGQVLTIKLK